MNSISGQMNVSKGNMAYNKAQQTVDKAKSFQDILKAEQGKENLPKASGKAPVDKKLMDVCYEFESLMINQMLKVMKKTVHKENSLLYGGNAEEVFEDMLYDKYSMSMAKTANFGLAKQIYDQLNQIKPSV